LLLILLVIYIIVVIIIEEFNMTSVVSIYFQDHVGIECQIITEKQE